MSTKMSAFEQGLLQAVMDMNEGRAAKVHTPEEMAARRRGRPPLAATKVAVKIRLDADLLVALRGTGVGWQTRINEILRREFLSTRSAASTISVFDQPLSDIPHFDAWLTDTKAPMVKANQMAPYFEIPQVEGAHLG